MSGDFCFLSIRFRILEKTKFMIEALKELNWLAVVCAALASFALGGLWYSPLLFVKPWMKGSGMTEDRAKEANMPLIFGTTFVLQVIAAIGLGIFTLKSDWCGGAFKGAFAGVVWVSTSIGTHYLFERKSLTLFLINCGYSIALLTIMGAILGGWK